ncbi:hypothetical protein A2U01_0044926, partial [Trifolium medium]|nr:hypothetical protein [Trifolium medium]
MLKGVEIKDQESESTVTVVTKFYMAVTAPAERRIMSEGPITVVTLLYTAVTGLTKAN